MMRAFRFALAVAVSVAAAPAARAGVYCSLDQLPYPVPAAYQAVNGRLSDLRSLVNTEEKVARQDVYRKRAEELEAKAQGDGLTLDERLDLSGIYLRLNQPGKALPVLEKADRTHHLVLAQLATVYDSLGLLDKAVAHQEKALEAWPAVWPNLSLRWGPEQLTWYRRAERYYLELLRLRQQEARTGARGATNTLDNLFTRLRMEDADGRYLVGGPRSRLPERLPEDVPPDAREVVAQLMWWLPFDNRLFWLYGEVLNYQGDVADAHAVLDEFFKVRGTRKIDSRVLFNHRRALRESVDAWSNPYTLFYVAAPRAPLAGPDGAAAQEVGMLAALQAGGKVARGEVTSLPGEQSAGTATPPNRDRPAPPAGGTWLPDWRTVAVSFAAGLFVMALVQFQWREWSRRRERALAARRELTS
jgi:hypothetical protein